MQQDFKQLKRTKSVHLPDGTVTQWRKCPPGELDVPRITAGHEGEFTQNNGVIAYVHEGELYITPACYDTVKTLEGAGFIRSSNVFVPFSNGDVPKAPAIAKKWQNLKDSVRAATSQTPAPSVA